MKRYLLRFSLGFAMIFTSWCLAGDDIESHKLSKNEKKEEKQHKKEMRELEKQQQQKRAEMEREKRKEEATKQKEEARMAAEERKLHKGFEKEHSQKISKLNQISKEEKLRMKELSKEKRAREKKERRHLEMQKREEEKHLACLNEKTSREEKEAKREAKKADEVRLAKSWKTSQQTAAANDYKEGKYSDVYMLPAWPFSNWFFNEKALLNVNATYWYAIDAYGSDNASRNITTLAFGEQTIALQDILLASKLLGSGTVALKPNSRTVLGNFIETLYKKPINFIGKAEKYGLEFDFARHVLRDDITIGVQIPVLYMKNHLRTHVHYTTNSDSKNYDANAENDSFLYKEAIRRILQSKGIDELGGSAAGLGDITLFGNVEVTTKYVEKIVLGLKVGLPTGKEDTTHKLWAPSLSSNDKCTEYAAFASMLLNYNRYFNPHLSLQASFFSTSHVNKRVPHMVSSPVTATTGLQVGNNIMAMGDRVLYVENDATGVAKSFSDWDSTVRGFADHSVELKFEKGAEFHIRLGNVFNKFIYRRGFLDIYYDLRAKLEDDFRGLDVLVYDIHKMEADTKSIEQRVGVEYSHQYDSKTRLKATLNYSFAGTNAPKVFDIGLSLGYSF